MSNHLAEREWIWLPEAAERAETGKHDRNQFGTCGNHGGSLLDALAEGAEKESAQEACRTKEERIWRESHAIEGRGTEPEPFG